MWGVPSILPGPCENIIWRKGGKDPGLAQEEMPPQDLKRRKSLGPGANTRPIKRTTRDTEGDKEEETSRGT